MSHMAMPVLVVPTANGCQLHFTIKSNNEFVINNNNTTITRYDTRPVSGMSSYTSSKTLSALLI